MVTKSKVKNLEEDWIVIGFVELPTMTTVTVRVLFTRMEPKKNTPIMRITGSNP